MLRIIALLDQKNHYLEKFYSLNETELLSFAGGNFDNLESFYQTREKILEMIKYLDTEVEAQQSINEDTSVQVSNEERHQVRSALAIKDEYVNRILAQDLEILSYIESAKSTIIRELQDIKKVKKAVGGYKSRTFLNKVDEQV